MKIYIGGAVCTRMVGNYPESGQVSTVGQAESSDIFLTMLISECRQKFPITHGWRNHSAQVVEMPLDVMQAIHDFYAQQGSFTDSDFEAFSLDAEDNPA